MLKLFAVATLFIVAACTGRVGETGRDAADGTAGRWDGWWRDGRSDRSPLLLDAGTREAGDGSLVPDADGDGIVDALEQIIAQQYIPYLSVHPKDDCPLHGILFRLSPHPASPSLMMIWYDVLYQRDCGATGHSGDDEVFGVVIDPSRPAPYGILAVRAISHQATPCQRITTCGSLPGCVACEVGVKDGLPFPVVFPSLDKHGNYVQLTECANNIICDFGGCVFNPALDTAPMVNAGEPGRPLVTDLTTQGFITAANGWTDPTLLHYNPWGGLKFGGASVVASDLVDPAFVVDPSGCTP